MVEITGVAHFAIPVSDPKRSTRFYTEINLFGGSKKNSEENSEK
jgi:catechol 2,3-dioxygenase-like lactoylglutathione lyase family enzyme